MNIDWSEYEQFDWSDSKQVPMNSDERSTVEEIIRNALGISKGFIGCLGSASPPGRYAATVLHVDKKVPHRFQDAITKMGITGIGVKVYKASSDANREFAKVLPFHNGSRSSLPGIPHPHVQRSLWADRISGLNHSLQGVAVQEWVVGQTLDLVLTSQKDNGPMHSGLARTILEQMLAEIIVPLWNKGTLWWDIRDANWCFDFSTQKLYVIDVDSLWAYADEILITPGSWTHRNKGRETALSRLKQTCWRVLESQFSCNRSSEMKHHHELWQSSLNPALRKLGLDDEARINALEAIEAYLVAIFQNKKITRWRRPSKQQK